MTDGLDARLDRLVPDCAGESGDWDEVLRRAAIAPVPSRRPAWRRRRLVAAAALAFLLVALVATPAFGIRGVLLDLIERTNVPFTKGKPAPYEVRREFFDLSLFAPPGMGVGAIESQTRLVGTFMTNGRVHRLYVAPTRKGGYCWAFSDAFTGCHPTRPAPSGRPPEKGSLNTHLLGVTWSGRAPVRYTPRGVPVKGKPPYTTRVGGDVRTPAARTVEVEYEDGTKTPIRFVYVSKPIDAGFFLHAIPAGHSAPGTRVSGVAALDAAGHVLARQRIDYVVHRIRMPTLPPRRTEPPVIRSPKLPPPTAPLQHAERDGVSVTAGRNGVAIFDTTGATGATRKLIAGSRVGYACFRFMRYHEDAPAELVTSRTTFPHVAIRLFGVSAPFDGCETQGNYGHTWPDRHGSHSAVEIPFTERGRRFFADRAAARDLSLFVRSREMHRIRKLSGAALEQELSSRYGSAVTRLSSPTAALAAGRIGYMPTTNGAVFVERSTTGRHFIVAFARGRMAGQNVRPLAFAF